MNTIYITTKEQKNNLIKKLSLQKDMNYKVYSLDDILDLFPYQHDDHTLDYMMQKYHLILENARVYLKQILMYDIDRLDHEKASTLKEMKEDLIFHGLLKYNQLFFNYLKRHQIICYIEKNKDFDYLFQGIDVTYESIHEGSYLPSIYELENAEKEIICVGEKIVDLLNQGVPPKNIFLCNLDDEYRLLTNRYFNWFHIPFKLKNTPTIAMSMIGSKFIKELKKGKLAKAIEKLENSNEDISHQIIDIVNKYHDLENQISFIIDDLKNTKIKEAIEENVVREISCDEIEIHQDYYVFIMRATTNSFPSIVKDEDYFTDVEKGKLGATTSKDFNLLTKKRISILLKSIPHLIVTYSKTYHHQELYPSTSLTNYNIFKNFKISFSKSHFFNQMFMAQELDDYYKYNIVSDELAFLANHYKIDYGCYDHQFKGIKANLDHLKLSYTSFNTYQKCPFQYYLNYILKINSYQETFSLFVGNLFHKILEKYLATHNNWEEFYDEIVGTHSLTYKEKFFLMKLKKDLDFIIETIEKQDTYCNLTHSLFEKEIVTVVDQDRKITFYGKIDKIKFDYHESTPVYVLIDYKTGTSSIKSEYMPLGFHLQLPIYLYLIKKEDPSAIIGGIYLQNILPTRIINDGKSSYAEKKRQELKWHGYSNNHFDILQMVDNSYLNSELISGLRVKQDQSFYKNSKVLRDEDIASLYDLVNAKIKETSEGIYKGDFAIQPKIIDQKDSISCNYCHFKDLCFHLSKDDLYLQSDKTFLKREEEENGMD